MNSLERLVYMANQIAKNLATMGVEKAAVETADHIHAFWDPRMKSMIFARLDAGGEGLDPIALEAIHMLRHDGPPGSDNRATDFNAVDEVGHSDAG